MNKKTLLLSGLGLGLLGTGVASADEVYTVVPGDTVSTIAQKFNTTVEKIDEKNNLTDIDMIYVGQKLTIPTLNVVSQKEYAAQVKQQTVQYTQPVIKQVTQTTQTTQQTVTQQSAQKVVQQPVQTKVQQPVVKQQTKPTQVVKSSNGGSAKSWIAMKESTNNYNARNGRYIGKYQLDASYLNGDYSPANQERVAEKYVKERYGSWEAAKAFHLSHGWY